MPAAVWLAVCLACAASDGLSLRGADGFRAAEARSVRLLRLDEEARALERLHADNTSLKDGASSAAVVLAVFGEANAAADSLLSTRVVIAAAPFTERILSGGQNL